MSDPPRRARSPIPVSGLPRGASTPHTARLRRFRLCCDVSLGHSTYAMGETKLLPLVSLLSVPAKPRPLPSLFLAVLEPAKDPTVSLLLTEFPVSVRYCVHPLLVDWLTASGWEAELGSGLGDYRVLRRRPSPRTADDPALTPLRVALGNEPRAAQDEVVRSLLVNSRRTTRQVGPFLPILSAGRVEAPRSTHLLRYDEVGPFLEHLRAAGGLACAAPAWFKLEHLARSTLMVHPSLDNPALSRSRLGSVLDVLERPDSALARVEETHLQLPVAVHPDVIDVAAMAVAASADRPGLLPEQDRLASVLLASETGAVLAPPPGSGKTVIAAAALAELSPDTALIAAPLAVLGQWSAELARWAPNLSVGLARSVEQVATLRTRRQVVLASHQVMARSTARWRTKVDVVVIDEAHALLRRSETADLLRASRRLAKRAWAITGSPGESASAGDLASLVAWVRGLPSGSVQSAPKGSFAPILCGHDESTRRGLNLPLLDIEPVGVPPSPEDLSAIAEVLADPLPARGLARRRRLEQFRLALGDPAAANLEHPPKNPSKRSQMVAAAVEHATSGTSVLVFSSSLQVLDSFVGQVRSCGLAAEVLPGSDSRADRVRVLSAFNEGVLSVLAVPPSSQRGTNLQRAGLVIHMDLPAIAAEFVQRNGRAARIGSSHPRVRVLVPYLTGTQDEAWTSALLAGSEDSAEFLAGFFEGL